MARTRTTTRRPRQNYHEMGLEDGTRLEFLDFPQEIVKVESKYHLWWNGRRVSLTTIRCALGERLGQTMYRGKIVANGSCLGVLYVNRYGLKASSG